MSARTRRHWLPVAVLGLAVLLLPLTASAAPVQQTIEIKSKRTALSLPAAPAVGLPFLAGGDLFDTADKKVGEGYSSCLIAKIALPELTAHCTSAFRLADGEIHLSSLRTYSLLEVTSFKDGPMAVIGGTGAYQDARGQATTAKQAADLLNPTAPVSYTFTITLSA
ncbi:hypothetical protein JOF53_006941 [Crossiella equi]|uniref:Allene oxide cyclase barrel-like domain-containing protein n=1 Tax=Crossiella equi TaxID=130796 RepID=A0ABS5ANB1_9PSEU|nr:hypothetical protein [Crossiella equi]MBP2478069.1 hypothetical protein [Crossiella equi]